MAVRPRSLLLFGMILAAALTRFLPHPPNLTPIAAMALFGGAYFSDRRMAFLVPLSGLFLSDLFIGLHGTMPFVYGSFALVVGIGLWLRRRRNVWTIGGAALISSILFFLITNFGVWAVGSLYPKTWEGLLACYVAALPFFRNTIIGNLVYTTALFGSFVFAEKWFPVFRQQAIEPTA